jgi:hypothetical protein
MTAIRIQHDGFDVDADLIAKSLHLEAAQIPALMRAGKITARCERGELEDAGRYRLTFLHRDRRLHLVVDEQARVLETTTFGE